MSWYSVSLFLKSIHEPSVGEDQTLWEECIYLVEAGSENEAREKGLAKGKTLRSSYTSMTGDLVTWDFVDVERVVEISMLADGEEIFSRFLKNSEAQSILTKIEDE